MLVAEAIPYKTFKEKINIVTGELKKNRHVEIWDKYIHSTEKVEGNQMNRYWVNQSGAYDPVATEVIKRESKRDKEIYDTINQVKNILIEKDLELVARIQIKDKLSKKIYK